MKTKNWKEKANEKGIEVIKYQTKDGNYIDGWYLFSIENKKCISQNGEFSVLINQNDPYEYNGYPLSTRDFDYFVNNVIEFDRNNKEYHEAVKNLNIKFYLGCDWSSEETEKHLGIYGTERSKFSI